MQHQQTTFDPATTDRQRILPAIASATLTIYRLIASLAGAGVLSPSSTNRLFLSALHGDTISSKIVSA